MFPAFSVALSALKADSTAIDVVGNDLANLDTTGYKSTDLDFEDLMAQNVNSAEVGMGVGPVGTFTNYSQGTLTATGGATDSAIQGNGFYIVQGADGQTLYTRDGSFQLNATGTLVTATGQAVQGWSAVNGVVNPNGPVGDLTVPLGVTVPATATSTMSAAINLDSNTAANGTFSAPIQVIDSQGNSHTLTVNFTETSPDNWGYTVTIPATDLTEGGTTTLASGTMTFDTNGNLLTPAAASDPQQLTITGLADGAADMNIGWNLFSSAGTPLITQSNQASAVGNISQNGVAAGQITNFSLENGGLLTATYSNGQQITVGQIALASIPNPNTMIAVGDNNLETTNSTGTVAAGGANTGNLGQIVAGSLEGSTVDVATEFTNLLTYERSYQAASRVITTADQLLQDTLDLIHA